MDRPRRLTVRRLITWAGRAVRWTWRVLALGAGAAPDPSPPPRILLGSAGGSRFCLCSLATEASAGAGPDPAIRAEARRRFEQGALFAELGRMAAGGVVVGARIREETEGAMTAEHLLVFDPRPGEQP